MKTVASLLAALLIGGAVSAQTSPTPIRATDIRATFFNGNPFDGGSLIETDFAVQPTDSSVGRAIALDEAERADYVLLSSDERQLAFETSSVTSTIATRLKVGNTVLSLGEVTEALYDTAAGETQLAIFTDADGVVTGFYDFAAGVDIAVDVDEADVLLVAVDGAGQSYVVADSAAATLGRVAVQIDGERITLNRLKVL